MEIIKMEKTGRKATIAGFDLDNRDKCLWKTTTIYYTTEILGINGEENRSVEHSMGSIGQMEFVCPTDSDLCRIITEGLTVIVLYGDIGIYPKHGAAVNVMELRKLELSGVTKISFAFR